MLSVRDVEFGHTGSTTLFRGVDLDIKAGEAVAIIGPSGIGKSTLLRIVGGITRPIRGCVGYSFSEVQANIAWVTQRLDLSRHRSVVDNCMSIAAIDGRRGDEKHDLVSETLSRLGLGSRASMKARVLSGGESQRLVVARALVCDRPLILADEPTNQLDRWWAERTAEALTSTTPNRSLLMVTHDSAAASVCHRVLTLTSQGLREE